MAKRKPMSAEQRQAYSDRMKAIHAAKKAAQEGDTVLEAAQEVAPEPTQQPDPVLTEPEVAGEQSVDDLKRQLAEMKQNQDLMMMLLKQQGGAQNGQAATISTGGKLLGEIEKYAVDPANYADPTERLRKEPRLQPLAFDYNYELEYQVEISSYETKTGANFKEPRFTIRLNRVVLDEQGVPTNKRYIARRLVFHEDPQAAIVIARDNGIALEDWTDMDNTTENQKAFLNEMRYLRVRDWLFGVFWPAPVQLKAQVREEVIGGSIVQVFTKSSEESSAIDFDSINNERKLRI